MLFREITANICADMTAKSAAHTSAAACARAHARTDAAARDGATTMKSPPAAVPSATAA